MTDPVVPSVAIVSTVSAVLLDLLGIDVPPLLWAFIGAALMQGLQKRTVSRFVSVVQSALSGFMGSILGLGFAKLLAVLAGNSELMHIHIVYVFCAIGGAGAFPLTSALVSKVSKTIGKIEVLK